MTVTKHHVSSLAIGGSQPQFPQPVHVGEPAIGNRLQFLDRVNDILDRRWLTNNGRYVRELEDRLSDLLGVKHCILVSNCTAGLGIALKALDIDGEVIVPAFTFVGTVHAIQWGGLDPVLCDVDPVTHCIDPDAVEALITTETSAILGVHLWGQPCAIEQLTALATRYNLKLLYDAAHAFFCRHEGTFIGNFGHMEVMSFHATKWFNTLEGGAIVTNDDGLASRVRLMRNFGFAGKDQVNEVGINAKMNEISAAMGLTLIDEMEAALTHYSRNYRFYEESLGKIPGIQLLRYPDLNSNHGRYIVIEVDKSIISRDLLCYALEQENVLARRYFYPGCHNIEPYRSTLLAEGRQLPTTDALVERVLCLPNNLTLAEEQIRAITSLIRLVAENAPEIEKIVQGRGWKEGTRPNV